jgi:hypothetical protein
MGTQTMSTGSKCEHPGCNCQVAPGEHYCGTACADSAKQGSSSTVHAKGSENCGCEHQGCAIAA